MKHILNWAVAMEFLSKINATEYTTIAFLLGIILCDDFSPAEQNSVGNFFMMIGQVLCTNASQQQVINNVTGTSKPGNQHIVSGNVDPIKRAVNHMNEELKKF